MNRVSSSLFSSGKARPPDKRLNHVGLLFLQGFKKSPTLFLNVLAKEMEQWQGNDGHVTLLQYVDDLLIGSNNHRECLEPTISLLNFVGLAGYRISVKKGQIANDRVRYLGFEITQGQRKLSAEWKEATCSVAVPTAKKQLRQFLSMARWCQLWIPNFGLIATPLYAAIKCPEGPFEWTAECQKGLDEIQKRLLEAPALGRPSLEIPFQLYVHKRQQVALRVLTQR